MKLHILLMVLYCDGMRKNQEEMGICSIAAFLRQNGFEVSLISIYEAVPDIYRIQNLKPDIIGIPVYEINRDFVYYILSEVKTLLPDVITIAGGMLPTYYGKQMLKECKYIDYAIAGEGELAWLDIVNSFGSGQSIEQIKSVIYRKGCEVHENQRQPLIEDLDNLPFPARDIFIKNSLKIAQLSTSRGCFAACSFCASQLFWKKWRGRSIRSIVDEMELLVNQYGIRFFNIIDGSFEDPLTDPSRMSGIASEIVKRKLNIFYYVQLRAEFQRNATRELMDLLKMSGLASVCVGIESGNSQDLKLYNKIAVLDDSNKMISLLREYDINVEPGFINFNPYSTLDNLELNIDFLEKNMFACNIEYVTTPCKLYEGTQLYKKVQEDFLKEQRKNTYNEYFFRDDSVARLCEYVNSYTNRDKKISDINKAAGYYATRWLTAIACYKSMFCSEQHKEAYQVLLEYEKEHLRICDEVNYSVARWFRKLIQLARCGWDMDEADHISAEYLSEEYMINSITNFDRKHYRFNKELIKINYSYADQLLDFLAGS